MNVLDIHEIVPQMHWNILYMFHLLSLERFD